MKKLIVLSALALGVLVSGSQAQVRVAAPGVRGFSTLRSVSFPFRSVPFRTPAFYGGISSFRTYSFYRTAAFSVYGYGAAGYAYYPSVTYLLPAPVYSAPAVGALTNPCLTMESTTINPTPAEAPAYSGVVLPQVSRITLDYLQTLPVLQQKAYLRGLLGARGLGHAVLVDRLHSRHFTSAGRLRITIRGR